MASNPQHPTDESVKPSVESFDDEYGPAHPTLAPSSSLLETPSSSATPAPPDSDEDLECMGRPIDITKFHGPTSASEVADMRHKRAEKSADLVRACASMIDCLGEDLTREGLQNTPTRMAKALTYFTSGYETCLSDILNGAVFTVDTDDLVVVRDVDIFSMCEHHLVPFFGKMHVGYLPRGKVLGLSKVARIAEVYSRRLQVQERLTREIAQAIMKSIDAAGVAVVIECTHLCMVMRGVQKVSSNTVTSCMLGEFRNNPNTRREFLSLINRTQFYR